MIVKSEFSLAGDAHGQPFCLVLDGSERGTVHHLQRHAELDDVVATVEKTLPTQLVFVADSFSGFYELYCRGFAG